MERKEQSVSLVFFVALLCICCSIDFVKASMVTIEKGLNKETSSELHLRRTTSIEDTSSRRKRSIQEQGVVGQVDVCADILGPKWNKNKQGKSICPTLVVWVPKKDGFTEFVKVNKHSSKVEGGLSIAIFCYALQLLPFKVEPIFKPFVNDKGEMNGTYDQLLQHIEGKSCEAVAGDITIRSDRTQYVDFTIPYMSSAVYMLVHAKHKWNQTLWTFLKPFTPGLWISLVASYILTGLAIAFLESRSGNLEFKGPFYYRIMIIIWYPISRFFFHEGEMMNKRTKVVLILWFCMTFMVIQIFTATLSSWLTVDQLHPKLPSSFKNIGYPADSYLKEFIMNTYNCSKDELKPLKSAEEYKNALSEAKVDVVIHELPYIDLFLTKYGSDFMKHGPIGLESGLGFAFPTGSPMLLIFSRAVIKVTESEFMRNMTKKYLLFSIEDNSAPGQGNIPEKLGVPAFIGLFIFMGVAIIVTIISSELSRPKCRITSTPKDELEMIETSESLD